MASPNKDMKTGAYAHPFEGGVGGYEPFRMKAADYGNSPMDKNFGINGNRSEMAIKTKAPLESSPGKFRAGLLGGGGGFGGSMMDRAREMMKKKQAQNSAVAIEDPEEAQEQEQAMAVSEGRNMPDPVEAGGGEVPMHGHESHTKPKRGGLLGNLFGSNVGRSGQSSGFGLVSDIRLKEKIQRTGVSPSGIPTYEFNYLGGTNRYSGAMAQDLLAMNSDAVSLDKSGYYKVNYNNIDINMYKIN